MNQVLSQNEVDALLAVVSDEEKNNKNTQKDAKKSQNDKDPGKIVVSYDLTSQDRIIHDRLPQLDVIYERFMRSFRVSLSSTLRKVANLEHTSTDFLKFGEFTNLLSLPTCMSVLRFNALGGHLLLVIESNLAYALIDSFFGGSDNPYTKIEGKEFTPIELSIIKKVVDLCVSELEEAWSMIKKVNCSFIRMEVNPQFVGIVPPTDIVISSTFDVDFENSRGTITLVIPYSTIEPIKQKLSSSFQMESRHSDKSLMVSNFIDQLMDMKVEVKVDLGKTKVFLDKFINWQIGDVVLLDQSADGELAVQIEGMKKFYCMHGVRHGSISIKLTKEIQK